VVFSVHQHERNGKW